MLLRLILSMLLAAVVANQDVEPMSSAATFSSADRILPLYHHEVDSTRMEDASFIGSTFSLGLWTISAGPLISSAAEVPKNKWIFAKQAPKKPHFLLENFLRLKPNLNPEVPVIEYPSEGPTSLQSDFDASYVRSVESGAWIIQYLPPGTVISSGAALVCGIITFFMAAYMLSYQHSLIRMARQDGLSLKERREKLHVKGGKAPKDAEEGGAMEANVSLSDEESTLNPPSVKRTPTNFNDIAKPSGPGLPGSVISDNESSDSGSLTKQVNGVSSKNKEDLNLAEGDSAPTTPTKKRFFRLKSPKRKKTPRSRK